MDSSPHFVDLTPFRTPDANGYSGRDRGEEVRSILKLDELISSNDNITLLIPKDTWGISPSFMEGLLLNAVITFGQGIYNRVNCKLIDPETNQVFTPRPDEDFDPMQAFRRAVNRILSDCYALAIA